MYSPADNFKVKDIQHEKPTITKFSKTRKGIYQVLRELDVTKWSAEKDYPPVLYEKTAERTIAIPHSLTKNIN